MNLERVAIGFEEFREYCRGVEEPLGQQEGYSAKYVVNIEIDRLYSIRC
jgi:hypothetical protein